VDEWRTRFGLDDEDLAEFKALADDAMPPPPPTSAPEPEAQSAEPEQTNQPFSEALIAEAMRLLDEHEP
jgi:hypothetical protein